MDVSNGNSVYDLINRENQDERTFKCCFEQRKITSFPLYEKTITEKVVTSKETSSSFNKPRLSARLKSKRTQNLTNKIKISSRFEPKGAHIQKKNLSKNIEVTLKALRNIMKTTDTIDATTDAISLKPN